jgi:hypothetical protein
MENQSPLAPVLESLTAMVELMSPSIDLATYLGTDRHRVAGLTTPRQAEFVGHKRVVTNFLAGILAQKRYEVARDALAQGDGTLLDCLVRDGDLSDDQVEFPSHFFFFLFPAWLLIFLSAPIRQILDEMHSFFLVGHDASTSAVAFTMRALAAHPEYLTRATAEARSVIPHLLASGEDALDAGQRLVYIDACIKESMRLWSPAAIVGRTVAKDGFELEGRPLQAGVRVF